MTFLDRYESEKTWSGRAMVMEIFHLAAIAHDSSWTLTKTANYFEVSIGLASENLRLAQALHVNEGLMSCTTRQEALRKMR